jgi:endo-1,4-beta-D-glucanase Y
MEQLADGTNNYMTLTLAAMMITLHPQQKKNQWDDWRSRTLDARGREVDAAGNRQVKKVGMIV